MRVAKTPESGPMRLAIGTTRKRHQHYPCGGCEGLGARDRRASSRLDVYIQWLDEGVARPKSTVLDGFIGARCERRVRAPRSRPSPLRAPAQGLPTAIRRSRPSYSVIVLRVAHESLSSGHSDRVARTTVFPHRKRRRALARSRARFRVIWQYREHPHCSPRRLPWCWAGLGSSYVRKGFACSWCESPPASSPRSRTGALRFPTTIRCT